MTALRSSHAGLITVSLCMAMLSGCQSLPNTAHLEKSLIITQKSQLAHTRNDIQKTLIASNTTKLYSDNTHSQHQGSHLLSGYYPIGTGANAFASRSILTNRASHTIDIQYYIWHNDEAGQMMIKTLWKAAERGVIIRLLLDDFNSSPQLDELLLAFAKHPNIAVRLVNPMTHRKFRTLNYLTNPARINRRMHNKSMTFDNQISIIGGRNIGDEYLNNAKNNNFTDMDVLLIGPVVNDITKSFETYWMSASSYDIEAIAKPSDRPIKDITSYISFKTKDGNLTTAQQTQTFKAYQHAIKTSTISEYLLNQRIPFRWAKIEFLADDAGKLTKSADLDTHLLSLLQTRLGRPHQRLSIISSYFVPTKNGVRTLIRLAKSGVKISILTNSFDATDVGAVHAGYGHWRQVLLSAGIHLYELKSTAVSGKQNSNKFWRNKQTTSLHAKAFAVDNKQVFIGSYNIDPRSANINTELGVLIYDERLAKQLHNAFDKQYLLNQAYKVVLTKKNTLEWHTLEHGKYIIYQTEPNMNLKDRAGIAIMSIMPIDWLL